MPDEIVDTWPRFFAHWSMAAFGFFLRSLLPVLASWLDPSMPIKYPRWWVALLFAAVVCALGGLINSNLPPKPRELMKSLGLGFAFDAAMLLGKINPL
jgi:hypothetical protein